MSASGSEWVRFNFRDSRHVKRLELTIGICNESAKESRNKKSAWDLLTNYILEDDGQDHARNSCRNDRKVDSSRYPHITNGTHPEYIGTAD